MCKLCKNKRENQLNNEANSETDGLHALPARKQKRKLRGDNRIQTIHSLHSWSDQSTTHVLGIC